MGELATGIEEVLRRRRERLPEVRAEAARWRVIAESVGSLHDIGDDDARSRFAGLATRVGEALDALSAVESRLARENLCVGVSGRARVGKSTLLQSISGLSDEQIPTGPDVPVTAVRSRIVHSTARRAVLTTHTADSFLAEVIAPYHAELGIAGAPRTLAEFRERHYPVPSEDDVERHSAVGLYERLRRMQATLDSYAGLLDGQDLVVDVDRLRPYVAYPTNDEEKAGVVDRRYLAVREAVIECTFPQEEVHRLTLVDLPGLGELAAGAEESHVAGLRHGIDVVLLVTAASRDSSYFGKADQRTLKLLDVARGDVRSPKDFVRIVLNTGVERERVAVLRDRILADVNAGVDGQYFTLVEADLKDREDVERSILLPLLSDLVTTLGAMDDEVVAAAMRRAAGTAELVDLELPALVEATGDLATVEHEAVELVGSEARALRQRVSFALRRLVSRLQLQARDTGDNDAYLDSVTAVFTEIREWIGDGFGLGAEKWRERALLEIGAARNTSPFVAEEMSRLRVEISKRFSRIDAYFATLLHQTWDSVAEAFTGVLGPLLGAARGEDALRLLAKVFEDASCRTLRDAVADLLETRLDYRTQLHPRVRAALDGFNLEGIDPLTGEPMAQLVVTSDEAGLDRLESRLAELTEQAAYETMLALQRDAVVPSLVVHAAVEQFEDELIRSGRSEPEFARLARTYRHRLWSDELDRLETERRRAARVALLAEQIAGALADRRTA
ncbi:hypothetical protein ABZ816_02275 [Actinosynnema sp. NPDC047251]|uniref:Dynamin family protein n=1 Tax=Saccharothrix espanaensis (strain ATCC 51144 / DSM 44229 / JCM 9112 / NBRC 15066 / NRRL 15764) TaxID=1179773 RepID=K0K3H0_SACES|nr:hypothetical protein [Saccharothrix espanaensis]CCH31078.1 hypothetical protein BN6_37870 [Saccharothrix espanaensis DSM 44229]